MPRKTTTVTAKGQVTIPRAIRDRKGITAGTRLEVIEKDGDIVLRKARTAEQKQARDDPEFDAYLDRVQGTMKIGMSTDEFMELLRGE
jgi:AbrB family looped-hinge helix DNA binding protein